MRSEQPHGVVGRAALNGFAGLVLLFLALPNMIVVPISFNPTTIMEFPPRGFTTHWYARYVELPGWLDATFLSLLIAVLTALLSLVIGTLAAYGLARGRFRGKTAVKSLLLLPLVVPSLIFAIAIYKLFLTLDLVGTIVGFVIAHSVLAIPFVVTIMNASLLLVDPAIENAARTLGANRLTTLRRVTLPLVLPGLLSAALLAFLVSFDELIVALFLSDPYISTLPKKLWDGIMMEVDPTLAAVSTILMLVSFAVLGVLALLRAVLRGRQA
jgi:ABC-type spermidine/putrescine transport system permease subunit II